MSWESNEFLPSRSQDRKSNAVTVSISEETRLISRDYSPATLKRGSAWLASSAWQSHRTLPTYSESFRGWEPKDEKGFQKNGTDDYDDDGDDVHSR